MDRFSGLTRDRGELGPGASTTATEPLEAIRIEEQQVDKDSHSFLEAADHQAEAQPPSRYTMEYCEGRQPHHAEHPQAATSPVVLNLGELSNPDVFLMQSEYKDMLSVEPMSPESTESKAEANEHRFEWEELNETLRSPGS